MIHKETRLIGSQFWRFWSIIHIVCVSGESTSLQEYMVNQNHLNNEQREEE